MPGHSLRGIDEKIPFRAGDQEGIRFIDASGERFYSLGCQSGMHLMMFAFERTLCKDSDRC